MTMDPEQLIAIRRWYEWAKSTPAPRFADRMEPSHMLMQAGNPGDSRDIVIWRAEMLAMFGALLEEVNDLDDLLYEATHK